MKPHEETAIAELDTQRREGESSPVEAALIYGDAKKRVSPRVLRHSAVKDLLQHGVDRSEIALWLGHESTETTQMYLAADLAMKEKALAKTKPIGARAACRFRPNDGLVAFLKGL